MWPSLLSLHCAVLGPLSSRFQPACCLCFSFPHPPLPFLRYLSVPRSLLASYFARRHLVKYFTVSDGWYLDSCWSGCEVAHPPSQLTSDHLIQARATLRPVRPLGRSPKLHELCNQCIHPSPLTKNVVARANTKRSYWDELRGIPYAMEIQLT